MYAPEIPLTAVILGMNLAVFVYMLAMGVPQGHPTGAQGLRFGADFGPLTLTSQPWRLLTSNYLHFGVAHLLTNLYCLWGLGKLTETFYPWRDFALLYTFTGVAGSLLSVWVRPTAVSGGASGAIFGLAGVMLATLRWGRLPVTEASRMSLYKGVLQFAGINLVLGILLRGIDNMGHLGGLLAGGVVGAVMGRRLDMSEGSRNYRVRAWLLLWLALLAGFYGVREFFRR